MENSTLIFIIDESFFFVKQKIKSCKIVCGTCDRREKKSPSTKYVTRTEMSLVVEEPKHSQRGTGVSVYTPIEMGGGWLTVSLQLVVNYIFIMR